MQTKFILLSLMLISTLSFGQKFVEDEMNIREKYRKIMHEDKENIYDSLVELLKQIKTIRPKSEATNYTVI